jgi:hypothetical protein
MTKLACHHTGFEYICPRCTYIPEAYTEQPAPMTAPRTLAVSS